MLSIEQIEKILLIQIHFIHPSIHPFSSSCWGSAPLFLCNSVKAEIPVPLQLNSRTSAMRGVNPILMLLLLLHLLPSFPTREVSLHVHKTMSIPLPVTKHTLYPSLMPIPAGGGPILTRTFNYLTAWCSLIFKGLLEDT